MVAQAAKDAKKFKISFRAILLTKAVEPFQAWMKVNFNLRLEGLNKLISRKSFSRREK
jgi:hypothetical protein